MLTPELMDSFRAYVMSDLAALIPVGLGVLATVTGMVLAVKFLRGVSWEEIRQRKGI